MSIMPQSTQFTIMNPSAYSPVAYYGMDPTSPNGRFDVYVSPNNGGAGVNCMYSKQSGDVGYGCYNNTQYGMSDYGQSIYQHSIQTGGYYPQQPYSNGFRPVGYPFGLMSSATQSMLPVSSQIPGGNPNSFIGPSLGRLFG